MRVEIIVPSHLVEIKNKEEKKIEIAGKVYEVEEIEEIKKKDRVVAYKIVFSIKL